MRPEEFRHVELTTTDGVGLLRLNRPDRRNAWSGPMALEYRWALHHCHVDAGVRVVVLSGAGRDFCVGADSRILEDIDANGGDYTRVRHELPPYPEGTPEQLRHNHFYPLTISTPVIAAIGGACAGAGFVLATYADIRFADASAKITSSFAKLGLPAEYGIGWFLPRMVGLPNAALLLYDPSVRTAAQAAQVGWVQQVVDTGDAETAALAFARRLARHSSGASLAVMKRQLFQDAMGDVHDAYRRSVEDMDTALGLPDLREGLRALKQRREPEFLDLDH